MSQALRPEGVTAPLTTLTGLVALTVSLIMHLRLLSPSDDSGLGLNLLLLSYDLLLLWAVLDAGFLSLEVLLD